MKNLILMSVAMFICTITTTAQSTFMGTVSERSTVDVQDLTTGIEYSFETKSTVVIPIDNGHDYFIAVRSKQAVKTFIVKQPSFGTLDDAFFDMSKCESFNTIGTETAEEIFALE